MKFPKIKRFLNASEDQSSMHYAVILNGYLQATNNTVGYYGSVEILTEEAKLRDLLEKRVFSREDLEALEDAIKIEYRVDGFKCYYEEKNAVFRSWTGQIDSDRQIFLYDDLMDEMILAKDFKKFPDMRLIVPALTKGDIDKKAIEDRSSYFRSCGIHADSLAIITEALHFKYEDRKYISMSFFHADKTKDKVNTVTAPILVTALHSAYDGIREVGVVSPVLFNSK